MIIRFQYVTDFDEELRATALIKVTKASVTPENALAYLITRYPERQNIEIIEIITDQRQSLRMDFYLLKQFIKMTAEDTIMGMPVRIDVELYEQAKARAQAERRAVTELLSKTA